MTVDSVHLQNMPPQTSGSFTKVPDNVTQIILSFLTTQERITVQKVCKNFRYNAQVIVLSQLNENLTKVHAFTLTILKIKTEDLDKLKSTKHAYELLFLANQHLDLALGEFLKNGADRYVDHGWADAEDFDEQGRIKNKVMLLNKFVLHTQAFIALCLNTLKIEPNKTKPLIHQFKSLEKHVAEKLTSTKVSDFKKKTAELFKKENWLQNASSVYEITAFAHLYLLVNKETLPVIYLQYAVEGNNLEAVMVLLRHEVRPDLKIIKYVNSKGSQEMKEAFKQIKQEMGIDDEVGYKIFKNDTIAILKEALNHEDSTLLSRLMSYENKIKDRIPEMVKMIFSSLNKESKKNRELMKTFIYSLTHYYNNQEIIGIMKDRPKWSGRYIKDVLNEASEDQKTKISLQSFE